MKRKRNVKTPMKTMLIFTASNEEKVYFNQVRKDCRYTNLTVKSAVNIKSFKDFLMQAGRERTKGRYSCVWAFFSFKDKIPEFDASLLEEGNVIAKKKRIKLGYIQPDLSIWFYLHLGLPNSFIEDSNLLTDQLRKPIANYELSEEYLSGEGQNLHLSLFSKFSKAIMNETQYNIIAKQKSGIPATNMDKLYIDIHNVCGVGDISRNQKTLSKN